MTLRKLSFTECAMITVSLAATVHLGISQNTTQPGTYQQCYSETTEKTTASQHFLFLSLTLYGPVLQRSTNILQHIVECHLHRVSTHMSSQQYFHPQSNLYLFLYSVPVSTSALSPTPVVTPATSSPSVVTPTISPTPATMSPLVVCPEETDQDWGYTWNTTSGGTRVVQMCSNSANNTVGEGGRGHQILIPMNASWSPASQTAFQPNFTLYLLVLDLLLGYVSRDCSNNGEWSAVNVSECQNVLISISTAQVYVCAHIL